MIKFALLPPPTTKIKSDLHDIELKIGMSLLPNSEMELSKAKQPLYGKSEILGLNNCFVYVLIMHNVLYLLHEIIVK
jgi:hypothetical protein